MFSFVCHMFVQYCMKRHVCVALVGESYHRAYRVIVQIQQMAELEEVIAYKVQRGGGAIQIVTLILSDCPTTPRKLGFDACGAIGSKVKY